VARSLGDDLELLRPRLLEQHRLVSAFNGGAQIGQRNRLVMDFHLFHVDQPIHEPPQPVFLHIDALHDCCGPCDPLSVGWVERSETQHFAARTLGLAKSSTQPTTTTTTTTQTRGAAPAFQPYWRRVEPQAFAWPALHHERGTCVLQPSACAR